MNRASALLGILVLASGCHSGGNRPVDIYPEDNCSNCRMAISDEHFASEIIDRDGTVFKFDDLGCMLKFRDHHQQCAAIYVKDYESKQWISFENALIVETSLNTPMGSGKVAFRDSVSAQRSLHSMGIESDSIRAQ
jgi:copper chaperone NosL